MSLRRQRRHRPGWGRGDRTGRQGNGRAGHGSSLLRGYLPLILVAVVVAAVVVVLRARGSGDGDDEQAPHAEAGEVGQTASGWGDTVQPCADEELQVPGDSYSPPCFELVEGADNRGATHRGVTADAITVTYRFLEDGHLLELLSSFAGVPELALNESPEDLWRTAEGLVEYFNQAFDFYGRDIVLERFDGSGSLVTELTNGGQDAAGADATRAANDIGAFAEVWAVTQPYAEALSRREVISVGAPYMSHEWFDERGVYAWSTFPDCSVVSEVGAELSNARLQGQPAVLAGGDLEGETRRIGLVHPNNLEYGQCADVAERITEEGGNEFVLRREYPLDLAETDANATAILTQLKDAEVTSVACGCDPLMVRALAQKAAQQGYEPEWFVLGVGFIDIDLVGQMIAAQAPEQWARAFGGSPSARAVPFEESDGYRAFKSVRPDEEPSKAVDLVYSQLYRLVIGIHMAGPELTSESFATGMYNYPQASGFAGAWDFSPDNHAGLIDARFVFWNPDAPSPFNDHPGTYSDIGERYTDPSEAPTQDEIVEMMGSDG